MAEKFRLPRPALLKLKAELAQRGLSASVLARVEGMFTQWDADRRVLTDRAGCQEISNHKLSYQRIIEGRGEVDVVEIDGRIRVTIDSIYRRLIMKMVETYEGDGDLKKIKPAPANMLKARAKRVELSRKRALERELAAAPPIKRGRGQAKKTSELSTTPAE